jgi:proliferating cell nuclear antigen
MKLTLAEPRLLKDSIAIISELVSETRLRVMKDYIELVAMDPANVAMVIFRMPSSGFAEYEVKEDTVLAMNLGSLKQILRRVKPSDVLTLEKADNKLKVIMKDKSTKTFYLPLIDLEERQQKIPNLTAKATVEFPSSVLTETIEDMDIVGESVTFLIQKDKLTVSAAGDMTKGEVVINSDKDVKITTETDQKSKYSIEYLKKMMLGSKLAGKAVLKLSNDYPLTLEYKETDKLSLTFILAPRVDND